MFGFKKFYYGDGTNHIVFLTKKMAKAINELRVIDNGGIERLEDGTNRVMVTLYLPDDVKLSHYQAAAKILNEYIERVGGIAYENTDQPVLRPVK